MALGHVIMSLLAHAPLSGYELAKKFEGPVGGYWKASQQQVYQELAKLTKQGELTYETIPQEGRLDKKIYCLTDLGKQRLIEWLKQPTEPTPIREDLAVKLTAAHLIPPELLITDIEHRRQIHQENLETLQFMRDNFSEIPECQQIVPEALPFYELKVDLGIRYESNWVAWCDETLKKLKSKYLP